MGTEFRWAPETGVTLLDAELNNLADGGFAVDTIDYDNAGNKYRWADFVFNPQDFDAAPDSGAYAELHLFYKHNGSDYADGYDGDADADSIPNANTRVGIFPIDDSDAEQQIPLLRVPLSPYAFKACLLLESGQDLTAVDTHTLKMYPYNEDQP